MDIRREISTPVLKDFQIHNPSEGRENRFVPQRDSTVTHRIAAYCDSMRSIDLSRGLDNWEAALAAKTQISGGYQNLSEFSMEVNRLKTVPFIDLKTLADAASTTTNSACATQRGNVNASSSSYVSIVKSKLEGNQLQARSTTSLADQDILLGSNLWRNGNCGRETPLYGNSIASQANCDPNLPPGALTDEFSSRDIPTQFAPITPDKSKKAENKMAYNMPSSNLDERTNQETDEQGSNVDTSKVEVEELHHDRDRLPNDLCSAVVSTQLHENHNLDKEGNLEIDMNRTPPQKPRRKRHRPKVVKEGQLKRTPKPATPELADPIEKPTGKRKYVRKNKLDKTSGTPAAEVTSGTTDPAKPTGKRKYVRKNKLDKTSCTPTAEVTGEEKSTGKRKYVRKNKLDKTSGTPTAEVTSGTSDPEPAPRAAKSCRKALNFDSESQGRGECSSSRPQSQNFNSRVESKPNLQLGQGMEATVEKTQVGIFYEPTCSMNNVLEDYIVPQRGAQSPQTPTKADPQHENFKADDQNPPTVGKCQIVFSDESLGAQGSIVQLMMKTAQSAKRSPNNSYCSNSPCLTEGEQAKGLKRGDSCMSCVEEPVRTNLIGDYYNPMQKYRAMFPSYIYNNVGIPGVHIPAVYKKKRIEEGHSSSTLSAVTADEYSGREGTTWSLNHDCAACRLAAAPCNTSSITTRTALLIGAQGKETLEYELALNQKERISKKRATSATPVPNFASLTEFVENRQVPTFPAELAPTCGDVRGYEILQHPYTCMEAPVADTRVTIKKKKQTKRNLSASSVTIDMHDRHHSLVKSTDAIQKRIPSIDEVIEQLKRLHVTTYNFGYQEQNAVVLYQRDGTVVPFEGSFNPVRKRRTRPKVNLDEETSRVWKLLLENINSEGIDGTDEEKAKWWEEERRVFRGRADSFIARMHLVQGDRRFSPWKGSVLDSVVGVFLTQNVSDHLSSSAFMSLAARFPLKSQSPEKPCSVETSISAKEQEVCVLDPKNTLKWQWHEEKSNQPACNGSSITFHDMNYISEKEVVNSNESLGSSSSSENSIDNSKCKSNISRHGLEMYNKSTANSTVIQLKDAVASLTAEKSEMDDVPSSQDSGGSSENSNSLMSQAAERIGSCWHDNTEAADPSTRSNPHSLVGSSFVELLRRQEERLYNHPEHKEVESSLMDSGYLPDMPINETSSNSSKVKKGRIGEQQESTEDWDSLRLQAQAKGKKRERATNTMDSLDWEAVRCADVNEIAYTIRERGMNNRLADRIKNFLNRLVKDHGSIDLEWLRDVPPDKAKEYLLSVRGLGLKSVECVRLLTLHHLAFPVDTNVGRIAVRLGWVPLQPLPESLQLHLLELYPVLESIQRYLWPRLCKLDQRTLYELHYQMITFGKVFCTKSKPNCNACPMRGECRHFASAFASARLALPGPEDKSIVCATENKAANQNPVDVTKPLQLLLPQANQQLQAHSQIKNCEPIVEAPASPEPTVELPATPELEQPQVPESDIEDAFCEDTEEIPMIKLNIEEFTQNLQNYMQQNMELQEGAMSKALVALTPEAASIPTPKLKNLSRLRTEHQVYELPDSHPLLQGLDKREPDDPCSYLLAIWTPGETANSIQPPEMRCSSQEFGNLCNEETCFSCNSVREASSQTVRGTILIPCRTAMRGSFPLNGTYFQVNEVFADHESSINPIDVPRAWIWNLPRRTVFFGTSIPTIFRGLSTESIQYCFWRGFVCVRGFDQKTRAPRPLMARLHFPASKLKGKQGETNVKQE